MTQSGVGKVEAFREEEGKNRVQRRRKGKASLRVQPGLTI